MSHTNCHLDSFGEVYRSEERAKLIAEAKFWKDQAEYLRKELENIPKALKEYGEWYIKIDNTYTHVVLDPAHHPAKDPS